MHMVAVGGSDAGISAALRAREVDPAAEVTVVAADAYPNFSICGIPYYVSGEVSALAEPRSPHERRAGSRRDDAAAGHHRPPHRRDRPQAPGHRPRRGRGTDQLRPADHRHRRRTGPAADQRADRPRSAGPRRRGAPAALDGGHLRADADAGAGLPRPRDHRRCRLHRPGDGRRADHPGTGGHPDGATAGGPAHGRPGTRRARTRRAGRPGRGGPDRHHLCRRSARPQLVGMGGCWSRRSPAPGKH